MDRAKRGSVVEARLLSGDSRRTAIPVPEPLLGRRKRDTRSRLHMFTRAWSHNVPLAGRRGRPDRGSGAEDGLDERADLLDAQGSVGHQAPVEHRTGKGVGGVLGVDVAFDGAVFARLG